jgi:hypothetical protein
MLHRLHLGVRPQRRLVTDCCWRPLLLLLWRRRRLLLLLLLLAATKHEVKRMVL